MDFSVLKRAVAAQFERMQAHTLFRVEVDRDQLWGIYLQSFPDGSDPLFRKRTEHDCACCRHFIRDMGNVVAVIDGKVETIWDVKTPDEPRYEVVCRVLAKLVRARPIIDRFLSPERKAGTDHNFDEILGRAQRWDHFAVNIDHQHFHPRADIPTRLNELRGDRDVFMRGLQEFSLSDIDTVLDLIAQNSIYRGAEHAPALQAFRAEKVKWAALDSEIDNSQFAWTSEAATSVKRLRNTAIGTLLQDLAAGKELEYAVKAFEKKVAPDNYKRTTALVTPAMVKKAKETIAELGLTSALDRRYALLTDLRVENLLFADRSVRKVINTDVFDAVAGAARKAPTLDRLEEMPIERFISDVLPRISEMEVLLEPKHGGNLVSLITAGDPTANQLFKWPNPFSWSYTGDVADAIKERVKAAGGNVEGDLCCRLAWHSADDLDLHMMLPDGGHIFYHNKREGNGVLDVDMNGIDRHDSENPVENIYFPKRESMRPGVYQLRVNQYNTRGGNPQDPGFEVQIEWLGESKTYAWPQALRRNEWVDVARFRMRPGGEIEWLETLPGGVGASRVLWGLQTQQFHKVRAAMLSPNYWTDNPVGNKHYFFMLEGCVNDGAARGFYNEFLHQRLEPHRKVLEMVGARMRAEGENQLSGLGFSSTAKNTLVARVKGSFNRQLKITF